MSDAKITDLRDLELLLRDGWNGPLNYFRGQVADWPLIPSLGRRQRGTSFQDVEARIVSDFKTEYERLFGHIAKNRPQPDAEKFDWDWVYLAVAQHHGLPTRLLDWTTNAEKALYFAVCDIDGKSRFSDGVLYAFHDDTAVSLKSGVQCIPRDESPLRIKNVRPFDPQKIPDIELPCRVKEQDGVLTCQPDPTNDLIAILDLRQDSRQRWEKWMVPRAKKLHLRQQLETKKISTASMFPGLDGLCRHLVLNVFG